MLQIAHNHRPDTARLRARASHVTLDIEGLGPAEASRALGLERQWFDWNLLEDRGGLLVDNPSAARMTDGPVFDHDFDDGHVTLRSGAAGRLWFHAATHRRSSKTILPKSFNLLLAQQWARGGVMPLHAAAFEYNGRGVLVLGERGSGKSTLGVAAYVAGANLVSDDWVLATASCGQPPMVERIRQFIMLRRGWASSRLLAQHPDPGFEPHFSQTKSLKWLSGDQQAQFPPCCPVDEVWLLSRPRRGRTDITRKVPAPAAEVLAGLIASAMPLLFGARFPHERTALMQTCRQLTSGTSSFAVETGLDLVNNPIRTLNRLCAQREAALAGPCQSMVASP